MTISVDKQWFLDRWAEKDLSLRRVARMIGMDPSALSRALDGKREIKVVEIGKIATILNVSRDEVLEHIEAGGGAPAQASRKERSAPTVAPSAGRHPGFGFMKGLLTIEEGYDLTSPSDEDWESGYLGGEHRDA
jgi:transcriptional regulator with XRE-family HTH domain